MEDRSNCNLTSDHFIKDSERETADHSAPQSAMDHWKRKRVFNDSRYSVVDTLHELEIESVALVRVPFAGLGEFRPPLRD